ncbi:beta-1,3-galactosyltransferase 1 [Galendromus occidentalis]|uniref:Hexosyltransferase n=1 Tax=Galendromus occidentalis TaxID=34638 RepID=A0AAJ7SG43_9ACAR|nr:beta-1,3-galactosyltransferase 1 [Galendromus occidentalis]
MKYQKLPSRDDLEIQIPSNVRPAVSSVHVSAYSTRASVKFGLFCFVFISLYCLIYSPLSAWTTEPGIAPNLTWVLRQRESFLYILQPQNFTAILAPTESRCDPQRLVTIVVCSAAGNDVARRAIRESWATEYPDDSRVFFLVGKGAPNDTKLQEKLEMEAEHYDDLIQEDFFDSYNNLTLKSAFLLKWANYSGCAASSRYILKTDDDMYINVQNLVNVLRVKGKSRMLLGSLITKAKPVRDFKSKWYVPSYVFSEKMYPDYLSGTGYVMSTDIVSDLLRMTESTPFFHMEDIYVTGLLARRLGVRRLNHEGFKYFKRKNNVCVFRRLISAHMMAPWELRKMFADVHDKTKSCR